MATPQRKQRRITSEQIDQTKPAYLVICQRFAGLTHFAGLTRYPVSTAYRWLRDGYIPPRRRNGEAVHPHILAVASDAAIEMTAADFVELPANDTSSAHGPPGADRTAASADPPPDDRGRRAPSQIGPDG